MYDLSDISRKRILSNDASLYLFECRYWENIFLYDAKGQKTEFEFYVGKKIWNKQKYLELCEKNGADSEGEYFPAYRAKTKE